MTREGQSSRWLILMSLLLAATLLTPAPAHAQAPSPGGKLLFKSGFESGVTVEPPERRPREWIQSLRGTDAGGHAWPDGPQGHFWYLVGTNKELAPYVVTRIDSVVGPRGTQTKALYQEVKQDDAGVDGTTRNQYQLLPRDGASEQSYIRYWIKLQPDLATLMPPTDGSWRMLMEWKEAEEKRARKGHQYRFSFYIIRNRQSPFVWKLEAQELLPRRKVAWQLFNKDVPVPIGEWFLLEAFWKRSAGNDGRVWFAVNGQPLFDHKGSNSKGGPLHQWHIFKVYTGLNSLARGPAYQWIDDVEIHSDVPSRER
jgi:hypothetical protein